MIILSENKNNVILWKIQSNIHPTSAVVNKYNVHKKVKGA